MTIKHLVNMTISYKVKINQFILGSLLPENWLFELQVKLPKKLGHLYPFEFTVCTYDHAVLKQQNS